MISNKNLNELEQHYHSLPVENIRLIAQDMVNFHNYFKYNLLKTGKECL